MYKIYVSPSLQPRNKYVVEPYNEQGVMHSLGDLVIAKLFRHRDKFEVGVNNTGMNLLEAIEASNRFKADIHLALHTNADEDPDTEGTEVYHHEGSVDGKRLAEILYKHVAPISPGKDRGVKSDKVLYSTGLAELRETICPAALLEAIYHTNRIETKDLLKRQEAYAEGIYKAVCEYFDVEPLEQEVSTFPDIDCHPLEKDIIEATKLGLVNGYQDGLFRPNSHITRAEVTSLILRLYNKLTI